MISYPITEHHLQKARERSIDRIIYNSVTGIRGNMLGALGEVMFEHWATDNNIGFTDLAHDMKDDYVLDSGLTVEVKTKLRNVPARPDYEVSVTEYNHHRQKSDYFIFVSLQKDKNTNKIHTAQILGGCEYSLFDTKGIKRPKGQAQTNGMTMPIDAINLFIYDLINPLRVIELWRKLE